MSELNHKLTGKAAFTLDELDAVAEALGVAVASLLTDEPRS
jgi:hypothetical protein